MHDETLTDDNKQKFLRTAEKYNQEVNFIDLSPYEKQLSNEIIQNIGRVSIGIIFRLLVPACIKQDKVIHLDCDMIVDLDISELWNIELENYYAAVVIDEYIHNILSNKIQPYKFQRVKCRLNHFDIKTYFNAGMIFMNLYEIRKNMNLFERSLEYYRRYIHLCEWNDQDILNSLFYNHVKFIDSKFNKMTILPKTHEELTGTIIHTVALPKLWNVTGMPAQYFYWDYYLRSAWGENTTREELVKIMLNAVPEQKITIKPHWTIRIFLKILNKIYPDWLKRTVKMLWIEFLYRIGLKK